MSGVVASACRGALAAAGDGQQGSAEDGWLNARAGRVIADYACQHASYQLAAGAQATFGEPATGLSAQLDALWDAFAELALEPAADAARRGVAARLELLAGRARSVCHGWDQLAAALERELTEGVARVNALSERLAALDHDATVDARETVRELAALVGATGMTAPGDTLGVRIGGVTLVCGDDVRRLAFDGQAIVLDGHAVAVGGALRAAQEHRTLVVPRWRALLGELLVRLADALHDRHAAGYDLDGHPGGRLLTVSAEDPGESVEVASAVRDDPRRLAAAGALPVAPHDGRNAAAMAALRSPGPGSVTDAVRRLTVDVRDRVEDARRALASIEGLSKAAAWAQPEAPNTGIDGETVALVHFHRALEACENAMEAVDEALTIPAAVAGSVEAGQDVHLRAALAGRRADVRNADEASRRLRLADRRLEAAQETLRMAGKRVEPFPTTVAERRAAIARLRALQQDLLELANTSRGGRPLFTGFADGDALARVDGQWTYLGDHAGAVLQVGPGDQVPISVTAFDALGFATGSDALTVLDALVETVTGGGEEEAAALRSDLERCQHALAESRIFVRSALSRVEAARRKGSAAIADLRGRISEFDHDDIGEAIGRLHVAEVGYDAAMLTHERLIPASLAAFLR